MIRGAVAAPSHSGTSSDGRRTGSSTDTAHEARFPPLAESSSALTQMLVPTLPIENQSCVGEFDYHGGLTHLPVFTARRCLVVPFSHFRYASATMKTLGGLGPTIIGVMLGQSILSAFFIFSRLYTKARINRSMGWDDHMATFSWVNNTKRRPERSSDEQSPGDAIMLLSNMLSCCDRRVWAAC